LTSACVETLSFFFFSGFVSSCFAMMQAYRQMGSVVPEIELDVGIFPG
jgi:hypothetical protein